MLVIFIEQFSSNHSFYMAKTFLLVFFLKYAQQWSLTCSRAVNKVLTCDRVGSYRYSRRLRPSVLQLHVCSSLKCGEFARSFERRPVSGLGRWGNPVIISTIRSVRNTNRMPEIARGCTRSPKKQFQLGLQSTLRPFAEGMILAVALSVLFGCVSSEGRNAQCKFTYQLSTCVRNYLHRRSSTAFLFSPQAFN